MSPFFFFDVDDHLEPFNLTCRCSQWFYWCFIGLICSHYVRRLPDFLFLFIFSSMTNRITSYFSLYAQNSPFFFTTFNIFFSFSSYRVFYIFPVFVFCSQYGKMWHLIVCFFIFNFCLLLHQIYVILNHFLHFCSVSDF